MQKIEEIIIVGGGSSISEGIELGLKDKIKNKFVITTNIQYRWFDSIFTTMLDLQFYVKYYEELKNLPLILAQRHPRLYDENKGTRKEYSYHPNTITFQCKHEYNRNILEYPVYSNILTGIFSITIASFLLNGSGSIYLLGFDSGTTNRNLPEKEPKVHWFQSEIPDYNKSLTYYKDTVKIDRDFKPFENEKNLLIYNVSLNSNINNFTKISYNDFFNLLNPTQTFDYQEVREYIKNIFSSIN